MSDVHDEPTIALPSRDEMETRAPVRPVPRRAVVALPERLGPYRVDGVLGRGGMGVVARARDERDGRDVALKFLLGVDGADDAELERVEREARLLASIRHPNVVGVLDVVDHEGSAVLVLELVEGDTLAQRLAGGPLPHDETARIAREIASALEAAHARGIVHRDLKPGNVKLAADGTVKVLDLGLACRVATDVARSLASEACDVDAADGAASGTLGYMSPEQVLGHEPTPAADTWAFGCLLYECLAGQPALAGRTAGERARATVAARVDLGGLGATTPAMLRELVGACLQRDVARRPADGAALRRRLLGEEDPAGAPTSPAAPGPGAARRLPRPRSRFVGRADELAEIAASLAAHRLVTLTGAGGSGKTRLALEAGVRAEDAGDDVVLVELAVVHEPALVAQQVATALDLHDRRGRPADEALVEALRGRRALLLLDNCEHVLDASRALAGTLLAECPGLRLLATSREPLRAPGERVVALPPLAVPAETAGPAELLGNDAAALFRDRAGRHAPELDAASSRHVARICRRLDGIPLALELAAARLRSMPLERLADELGARLDVVSGGSAAALPRHQALQATIDWSVDRLDEAERVLFRRLSVLAGPFDLELAEAVGAATPEERPAVLGALLRLVDRSLVQPADAPGEPRWRLLEPMRQHGGAALARAGGRDAARGRLLGAILDVGERAKPLLDGADVVTGCAAVEACHANLVESLIAAARLGDVERGLRTFVAFGGYWLVRGFWREGRTLVEPLLASREAADSPARAPALLLSGQLALMLGDASACAERVEEALAHFRAGRPRDQELLAECLNSLSQLAWERLDLPRARKLAEESLAIRRTIGRDDLTTNSLNHLGVIERSAGDLPAARRWLEESLVLQRRVGTPYALAVILTNVAVVALDQDDLTGARAALDESLSCARAAGSKRGELFGLTNLAIVELREGRWRESLACQRGAAALCRELGDRTGALSVLLGSARAANEIARPEVAARLLGAAVALRDASGAKRFHAPEAYDRSVARCREAIGDDAFAREHAAGRALSLDEALSECERLAAEA